MKGLLSFGFQRPKTSKLFLLRRDWQTGRDLGPRTHSLLPIPVVWEFGLCEKNF